MRQAQWRFSRHLPRALASGAPDLQPGVTARCSSARVGVGKRQVAGGGAWRSFLRRESAWARARSAAGAAVRRHAKFSSARGGGRGRGGARSAARRGARRVSAWAKALGREVCIPASWRCVPGSCRRGRRRGGLQLYQLRAAWGATGQLSDIWLGLWESASGGAAQSASMLIAPKYVGCCEQLGECRADRNLVPHPSAFGWCLV